LFPRNSPFFITGAQRSGTTLVRLILNSHSQVAIPEEGGFWMPILREYRYHRRTNLSRVTIDRYLDYIESNPQFKLWQISLADLREDLVGRSRVTLRNFIDSVYFRYAREHGKNVWGDKTPSFFRMLRIVRSIFPDSKIIHVVRDGRDVYLSTRRINPSRRNLAVQAFEWSYKVRKVLKSMETSKEHLLEVRYEDLVDQPEKAVGRICSFLNLNYESTMLEFWRSSRYNIGRHHSELIFSPISSKSVGKWQNELSKVQKHAFCQIAGNSLKRYGYICQEHGKCIRFLATIVCVLQLFYGLPIRIFQVLINALNMKIQIWLGITLREQEVGLPPEKSK